MIGKKIAHYEISGQLGAGGMGEVYRAHDTQLGRDVALKVLPEEFAQDAERMARFRREAQVLASLNHPNIAAIHGLETEGNVTALVLELVDGRTLADRIADGPLPLAEALPIALEIAEAIESAHEAGIVHRDLKPANVKRGADGRVKVLDFGLAKAFVDDPAASSAPLGDSPTISPAVTSPVITGALTGMNVILGTAAYMSPEQARGNPIDKRSDIWSFGVVLWEMLTGRRLFEGETVSDTLAAVLKTEPDWDALPRDTPARVLHLLQRCLERDPRRRLRDIGEARVRLEEWTRDPESLVGVAAAPVAETTGGGSRWVWPIVAGAIAVAAMAFVFLVPRGPEEAPPARRLEIALQLPHQETLLENVGVNVRVSPDDRLLAYRTSEGIRLLELERRESTLLPGTAGALHLTFSPDGRWIAYAAGGTLWRANVDGGAPVRICGAELVSRGLAWVNESTVVFAPSFNGGLDAVSLETGEIRPLTAADSTAGERSHRWPTALPDGRSVLFQCQFLEKDYDESDVRIVDVESGDSKTIVRAGSAPLYSDSGHVLFARDNTVFAVPLDLERLETRGMAVPVLSRVWASVNDQESDDGSAQFDVSPAGTLVYRTEVGLAAMQVTAIDTRTGSSTALGEPGEVSSLECSPDGRKLAIIRREGSSNEISLVDVESGGVTRFTFEGRVVRLGCWSPDSRTLYWTRGAPDGGLEILARPADGAAAARVVRTESFPGGVATSVSPDGRRLVLHYWRRSSRASNVFGSFDLGMVDLEDPRSEAVTILADETSEAWPQFSPDGRWMTYLSAEGNDWSIYLRRFPDRGARWLIIGDTVAAISHEWLADGSGILIAQGNDFYRIPIDLRGESPVIGAPVQLVGRRRVRANMGNDATFSPDGSIVYVAEPDPSAEEPGRIVLVTNWFQELEKAAPR